MGSLKRKMTKESNYAALKKFCQGLGIDLFGVADIKDIKEEFMLNPRLLNNVDKAISLAVVLSGGILEDIESHPTRLYFHHYKTVNMFLDQAAMKIGSYIQRKGHRAVPIPASIIVDWQSQKAHLSHRKIAYLAGLGWIGRNNLLVNASFGCQLRLVTILTDLPLRADKPARLNCGSCVLCIEACPAKAIKDDPREFDRQKCLGKLKEFQKQRLVDQYICGVCVKVCSGQRGRTRP